MAPDWSRLTFFNQAWRQKDLVPGSRGMFAGKVGAYRGERQLAHPDYELFSDEDALVQNSEEWAKRPIPLYPATSTVASWQIAKSLEIVLDVLDEVTDPLPDDIRASEGLLGFRDALQKIHRPAEESDWKRHGRHCAFMRHSFSRPLWCGGDVCATS
jgi:ATP-dependent DNA helicase RecG